jgi:hypothetical protein
MKFLIIVIFLLVGGGCTQIEKPKIELKALDKFFSILGSGDTSEIKSDGKKDDDEDWD